jgi:NitT/TauT family transport system substrate-binding protein
MLTRRDMLGLAGAVGAGTMLAAPRIVRGAELPSLTVGILEFGTVGWEIATMQRLGLDKTAGIKVETVRLASNDAARIAFLGGGVDTIVADLLWAARMRGDKLNIAFLPFSATEGAVMVPAASPIHSVGDLKDKTLGVGGGPLDKSWLLLQAYARKSAGLDLASALRPAFGAPPLLSQKLTSGELDAALLFWNFCARLEAKGFRRLVGADEISRSFGVEQPIAFLGYAFKEAMIAAKPQVVRAFASASRQAKTVLATQDGAWTALRPLMQAEDEATFQILKRRFIEGIPNRPVAEQAADAARLYAVLADLGGEKLVGTAKTLPDGLYWTE